MYIFDNKIKKPLCIQLYEQVKKEIINKGKVGDKLDSIRKVASTYNLSKNTVENAYSQLVVEGFVESIPKSGYVITDSYFSFLNDIKKVQTIKEEPQEDFLYDFYNVRLEKEVFPLKQWKRIFNKVVDESLDFGKYQDSFSNFGLRKEIKKYLIESRGVNCTEEQIIVCNGFADSMGLLAKLIDEKNRSLAIENPGYYMARKVFEAYNYKIEKIALSKNGIDLKQLENSSSKLVYITPSHQYPTGVTMPISNRIKILDWAKRNEAFIIEDDYDSELSYTNRPLPCLQGLDRDDRVIYVGTFSKALSPVIRVSYLVLPNSLIEKYKSSYESKNSRICLTTQKVLENFLKEGHWERHLRKIRTLNKKKHNMMKKLFKEKLADTMKIESSGAGLSILINPTVAFDLEKLKKEAKEIKMNLNFAKERCGGEWDALMMGFGGMDEEKLKEAIEVFCQLWNRCIK